jgi:ATP-dependent exoDNAse (exonuclease V) beta subunit
MFSELTLQQFCALDYNRNMVVTSGPGAGKTRILSHRYCFILLTDASVSIPQILTLTFSDGISGRENDEYDDGIESALILGTIVHEYLDKHQFGKPADEGLFVSICKRQNPSPLNDYDPDKNINQTLMKKALEQIERTVTDEKLVEILGKGERYSEIPFLFNVSGSIELRGVIDSLSKNSHDGSWTIIDWKSNELMERIPEDVAEENDYFLQLECYKWALERILCFLC